MRVRGMSCGSVLPGSAVDGNDLQPALTWSLRFANFLHCCYGEDYEVRDLWTWKMQEGTEDDTDISPKL